MEKIVILFSTVFFLRFLFFPIFSNAPLQGGLYHNVFFPTVVVVWKKYTCIVVANKAALGGKNTRREKEWLFCVANSVFGLYDGCFADFSVFLGDYTSIRIFLQDRVLLDGNVGDVGYIEQQNQHLH